MTTTLRPHFGLRIGVQGRVWLPGWSGCAGAVRSVKDSLRESKSVKGSFTASLVVRGTLRESRSVKVALTDPREWRQPSRGLVKAAICSVSMRKESWPYGEVSTAASLPSAAAMSCDWYGG